MRSSRCLILLASGAILLADPALAQSRPKNGDSRRVAAREQPSEDRGDRRRASGSDARRPMLERGHVERDDDRERADRERNRGIIGPIVVFSPRAHDFDRYAHDRYGYYYYSYSRGRVWNRIEGMTCLQLDDELEWAHDEWHYRNDRHRGASWYDVEHARLELRIAEERAYSGCGRSYEYRDCRQRGRYPRTGSALEIAILVLDILLGGRPRY